eukprot:363347-Chlamydomonas_euryale.AAC.5
MCCRPRRVAATVCWRRQWRGWSGAATAPTADRRHGAAALRGGGSSCCQPPTLVLRSRHIGTPTVLTAGVNPGGPWRRRVLRLEPDLRTELGCLQPCGLPRVAGRQAAGAGGQDVSGTGSTSWALGLGQPSGFLRQDGVGSLRGRRALVAQGLG